MLQFSPYLLLLGDTLKLFNTNVRNKKIYVGLLIDIDKNHYIILKNNNIKVYGYISERKHVEKSFPVVFTHNTFFYLQCYTKLCAIFRTFNFFLVLHTHNLDTTFSIQIKKIFFLILNKKNLYFPP